MKKDGRITVTDIKKYERLALDFYNEIVSGQLTKEEAAKKEAEIMATAVSYLYSDLYDGYYLDMLRDATKGALEYTNYNYDRDLSYAGIRELLYDTYKVDYNTGYFDIE